ncbi:MAG TPA: alpha/beta hydrolase [Smithellaceae bacterium]|nr:alpha/beta hydrolase [Smithellaceae bacterium]
MKYVKLALIIILILPFDFGFAAEAEYGYPISDNYISTIWGTPPALKITMPGRIRAQRLILDIFPDRPKPDIFFYDDGLQCTLAYQEKKAPLVFLIAGTGADDQSRKMAAMMNALYHAGYHVIALPSPTHPNFIVSASASHIPGDLTEDAEDIYRVMEHAWEKAREYIEASEFYLAGYSLGGTHAAFVAKLDEERKRFNFGRVLMVNPAVNLYNAVARIEALLDGIPGGQRKIGAYFNATMAKLTEFYSRGGFVKINDDFFYAVYKSNLFSRKENGGLIGLSFRISLAGMIFSSDVMTNSGYVVPKNRILESGDSLGDYFFVSVHLSFLDYFNEYFYPYFQKKRPGLGREAFIDSLGLKGIEDYLAVSPKLGVITNADDFILAPEEIDYLRRVFGERARIYPRGGHLGNLEYRDNMLEFVGFFKQ